MAKKIKQRSKPIKAATTPTAPLSAVFQDIAAPILREIGDDPVPATMTWAMGAVASAWNASRNPVEVEGLAQLDAAIGKLLNPAFSDAEALGAVLEEMFHLARVRHPRDPRFAVKVFVEKRGPSDFYIEVLAGLPKRQS